MIPGWPRAGDGPLARAVLRRSPEDFRVYEQLGFECSGEGEHVFLHVEKRELNTRDVVRRIEQFSGIPQRDIGVSGMKDRNAVTRQWVSVRMAGKVEPDWTGLQSDGQLQVLACERHSRKLKRGTHRANRFVIHLRDLEGDIQELQRSLELLGTRGAPNYFGEQRFGRNGATLDQAARWLLGGGGKLSRSKRSLYLSALRGALFNALLAQRVEAGTWGTILDGDVCMLQGSRSLFVCDRVDANIVRRVTEGDIHPGLPLWGRGEYRESSERVSVYRQLLEQIRMGAEAAVSGGDVCQFLVAKGLEISYRPARVLPDDFCWQFCDDSHLQLEFTLAAGSYATAVLAELVNWNSIKHSEGQ